MKKGLKTGTGGEFNAKAQRRGDAKKRVDWKKKAEALEVQRGLLKTETDRKDARIAELTGKLGAVVTRVAELAKEKEAAEQAHKDAAEIGLKACEEARGLKERVKREMDMFHDVKEKFLEMRDQRDELEKDLNETEAARAEEAKEMERAVAVARKLNEAVAEVLR